ncbi:50S ribosomal protein L6 [Candidatus Woesearchaeota archaeon]|nr:50S ribosomal protein L6 [Candidatus Woesearchaeota archaeon]
MKQTITEEITIPNGVTAQLSQSTVHVKGPKGETTRTFITPGVTLAASQSKITLTATKATKREKAKLYSTRAHLNNMFAGVQTPFVYVLKVCSGHFPMNVTLANNKISVKNFLGEKIARTAQLPQTAQVKIEGDKITISSTDKEIAGRTASDIEQLMRVSNRDRRIFQDGIYVIQKPGETA